MSNCGICRGQTTSLTAPFLLNFADKEIGNIQEITDCELLGREKLELDSITCFLAGSTLTTNKFLDNNTVLLFKFLTYVNCTPPSKSIETWSKAANSLANMKSEYEANKGNSQLGNILKKFKEDNVVHEMIDLRMAQMYDMIRKFVGFILSKGITSFDVSMLVSFYKILS